MRSIMKYYKIWLPLLSIVIFVGLAELICRGFNLTDKLGADFKFYTRNEKDFKLDYIIEDPLLMWCLKPNYSDGLVTINSSGFRDKEYNIRKDKNVFRILCLGDSSTFGTFVRLQETYHTLLENRLNEESGQSGIKFEIINAGVIGYSSCQGLGLYKIKGFEYKPDIVTFYFGANDEVKKFILSDKQIMQNDVQVVAKAALENNLLLKLHCYRIFRKYVTDVLDLNKNDVSKKVPRVSLDDFKKNILELNSLCKKNGSLLVLISTPLRKEDYRKEIYNQDIYPYRELLENVSKEYNIPLVRIKEMTEQSPVYTSTFFFDKSHPNQLGHWIIMQKLYDYLTTSKLIPGNIKNTKKQRWDAQKYVDPENDLEYLNHALRVQQNNVDNYKKRGNAYFRLGQYQRTIEDNNTAIRLKPDDADAFNNRAGAYAKLGQYQHAMEDYNVAIRLKPDCAAFHSNRAIVYLTQGDAEKGCLDAIKACDLGDCVIIKEAKSKGYCP